jgi:cobalt-zinc-cadmium efflux system protein
VLSVVAVSLKNWSAFRLVREAADILMEGVPPGLDLREVEEAIAGVDGVCEVHDLHVWTISSGIDSVSAHIRVVDPAEGPEVVDRVVEELRGRFGLTHTTIQVERSRISPDAHRLPTSASSG